MPQTDKCTNTTGRKYLCSNPNCRRVFSKPKIIKYHVCPTCQTMVNISQPEDQAEIQAALAKQKLVKRRKPRITEVESSQTIRLSDMPLKHRQPPTEEGYAPEEKSDEIENAPVPVLVQVPGEETIGLATAQQPAPSDAITASSSSSGCQYGFGYLSEREKGEDIPVTCIECARSLDCMLSKYYKKEESVREVKKWYNF